MLSKEAIEQQRLAIHRKSLSYFLIQMVMHGPANAPVSLFHNIDDARQNIQRIKTTLRSWNEFVEDHPDDQALDVLMENSDKVFLDSSSKVRNAKQSQISTDCNQNTSDDVNIPLKAVSKMNNSQDDQPKELKATLLHTLRGHENWVWCAAFSPDGKFVVSGSTDATIRVWDLIDGKEVRQLHIERAKY